MSRPWWVVSLLYITAIGISLIITSGYQYLIYQLTQHTMISFTINWNIFWIVTLISFIVIGLIRQYKHPLTNHVNMTDPGRYLSEDCDKDLHTIIVVILSILGGSSNSLEHSLMIIMLCIWRKLWLEFERQASDLFSIGIITFIIGLGSPTIGGLFFMDLYGHIRFSTCFDNYRGLTETMIFTLASIPICWIFSSYSMHLDSNDQKKIAKDAGLALLTSLICSIVIIVIIIIQNIILRITRGIRKTKYGYVIVSVVAGMIVGGLNALTPIINYSGYDWLQHTIYQKVIDHRSLGYLDYDWYDQPLSLIHILALIGFKIVSWNMSLAGGAIVGSTTILWYIGMLLGWAINLVCEHDNDFISGRIIILTAMVTVQASYQGNPITAVLIIWIVFGFTIHYYPLIIFALSLGALLGTVITTPFRVGLVPVLEEHDIEMLEPSSLTITEWSGIFPDHQNNPNGPDEN